MIFLHFKFLSNLRDGKGGTFMVDPGRILASLRHRVLGINKFAVNLHWTFTFMIHFPWTN